MRAAILREYGEPLAVREVPAPEPGPDEAVVRVAACGVCRVRMKSRRNGAKIAR